MRRKDFDKKWVYFVISITLCAFMFVGILPVSALPPNTALPLTWAANQPDTVFLGEKNVDFSPAFINALGNNRVAFFRISSGVPDSPPVQIVPGDNFDTATHLEFNTNTLGSWYVWDGNARGVELFKLALPNMSVQVIDPVICNNQDRTGTTVMNSQDLQFRVSLDQNIFNRWANANPATPNIVYDINLSDGVNNYPNIPGVVTNIPLINRNLLVNPDIVEPVPNPWDTNALDGKGQYLTPLGNYNFKATCVINGLEVSSPFNTVNLVTPSVGIAVAPSSVQRGNRATVTISGEPVTDYYFGIIECPLRMTGEICDRPPWIVKDSEINGTLHFAPDPLAMTGAEPLVPNCCGGLPFNAVVPQINPADGHERWVRVTTDCNGIASFLVDSDSDTWKASGNAEYTLHVQKVAPEIDGTNLFDQTTLTLTKGSVSIGFYDASDPAMATITEAFLGDLIGIKGTNTESAVTYLYMTGPCQPEPRGICTC
ncbi:MAG: DUF3821 domain-containing protein [Bacteroidota bacterium]